MLLPVFLYSLGGLLLGVALFPALSLVQATWIYSRHSLWAVSLSLGFAYFLFGLTLTFLGAAVHGLLGIRLRPGSYALHSLETARWAVASSLYMLLKYTFADFLACTVWYNYYCQLLGARLGKGVSLNSKFIHDHSLLTIGEGTIVGGDAVISCHAVEKGRLVLRPIVIGRGCLIGQKATIMPGAEIGDGAVIGAQALVLKNQRIPAGTTWVGIPARAVGGRE